MNIGIDVDGVLVDIEGYQLKYGKEYFLKVHNKSIINPKAFDIEQIFDCSHKEREKFWQKYIWGYCLNEPPFPNAPECISKLHKEGHKIVLITGRAHTIEDNITGKLFRFMLKHWLKKNKFVYDDIIYCSEKESSTDKLKACIDNDIDIMIDDKPENLLALVDKLKVICYPAIWNQDVDNEYFIRVDGWNEVYEYVSKLE